MHSRILLLVLVTFLALLLGYVTFTPLQAVGLVRYCGYWLTLVAVVCFGWCLVNSFRCGLLAGLRQRWGWVGVVYVVAAAGWMHTQERHEFKIVADEVLLSSTAMQMHFHREASVVLRGYEYAGNFTPMTVFLDKRPLLFPFLLSGVHDLTGYRVENVFLLNGVLGLVLVALTFSLGLRFGGFWGGVSAVLLLCGVPLVQQNVTGGGFELLNVVMILSTLLLGLRYIENRNDYSLGAFALSGVLLAQVRYESVLFVLPVVLTVFYGWWLDRRIKLPWSLLAAPLLLVIWPLHHNVFKLSEASWQLFDIEGATKPFGLHYFYDNVGHALNFFLSFDGVQPSSWPFAFLGCLCLGLLIMVFYKEHRLVLREKSSVLVAYVFAAGLLLHTVIMLCYFWGRWDDPVIRRLSFPIHVLFLLAILMVWPRLVKGGRSWQILAGIAAVIFFVVTVPSSAMHRFSQENFAARATAWLGGFVKEQAGRSVLAVDSNAGLQWFLYRQSSVYPARLAQSWEGFAYHFRVRTFDDFFVVQRVGRNLSTGEKTISVDDNFGDAFKFELIEEKAFAPMYLVRLSRILAVDEGKLKEWAEERERASRAKVKTVVPLPISDVDQLSEWAEKLP